MVKYCIILRVIAHSTYIPIYTNIHTEQVHIIITHYTSTHNIFAILHYYTIDVLRSNHSMYNTQKKKPLSEVNPIHLGKYTLYTIIYVSII